ncbi:orotate phosphoribosyltransferase [Trueperella abortisuis]|uniref:orotate phosphoribosyltransferase n=1 Tax=Trueperella abortisuis TaxID=445930 RepID=UPI00289312AB|nr:orotate phosphoribosyltransferase [Trueperella abortisuis]
MDINDAPKARLAHYLRELDPLTAALHREAAPLLGHAMLDLLEEAGLGPGNIEAIGGEGPLALAISTAILHAAASRGQYLDAFTVEAGAIVPAVGGPVVVVGFDVAQVPGGPSAGPDALGENGPQVGDPQVAGLAVVVRAAKTGRAGEPGEDGVVNLALFEASDLEEEK